MSVKNFGQTSIRNLVALIKSKFDSLSKVASTGSYKDLSDTPTFAVGSVSIYSDSVTVVNIPETITSKDRLLVYHNGLLITEGINYTLDTTTSSISLIGYTASSSDIFTFLNI